MTVLAKTGMVRHGGGRLDIVAEKNPFRHTDRQTDGQKESQADIEKVVNTISVIHRRGTALHNARSVGISSKGLKLNFFEYNVQ